MLDSTFPVKGLLSLVCIGVCGYLFFQTPETGATPTTMEQLRTAACRGDASAVERIVSDPNRKLGPSERADALQVAVMMGNEKVVKVLLANGAAADTRGASGRTPLMAAVGAPHSAQIAKQLLAAGATIDIADDRGETALSYAATANDHDLLGVLKASSRSGH